MRPELWLLPILVEGFVETSFSSSSFSAQSGSYSTSSSVSLSSTVCPISRQVELCPELMKDVEESCECYNFCNRDFVGCCSKTSKSGSSCVVGCIADESNIGAVFGCTDRQRPPSPSSPFAALFGLVGENQEAADLLSGGPSGDELDDASDTAAPSALPSIAPAPSPLVNPPSPFDVLFGVVGENELAVSLISGTGSSTTAMESMWPSDSPSDSPSFVPTSSPATDTAILMDNVDGFETQPDSPSTTGFPSLRPTKSPSTVTRPTPTMAPVQAATSRMVSSMSPMLYHTHAVLSTSFLLFLFLN